MWSDVISTIFAQGLVVARETTNAINLVNRRYERTASAEQGSKLSIDVSRPMGNAFDISPGVNSPDRNEPKFDSIDLLLNKHKGQAFKINAQQERNIRRGTVSMANAECVRSVLNAVHADILGLGYQFPTVVGNGTPFDGDKDQVSDANTCRIALDANLAPMSNRYALLSPAADLALSNKTALLNASAAASSQTLRQGTIGRIANVDWVQNNHSVPKEPVTRGTGFARAASADAVEDANVISYDGGGAPQVGDVFTPGAAYDPNDSYRVTAATATQLTVFPRLRHAVANDTVLSFAQQSLNTEYTPVWQEQAIALATRPLDPGGAIFSASEVVPGMDIVLQLTYWGEYWQRKYEWSVHYGVFAPRPQWGLRLRG